jgi:hypothetical protein
MRGSTKEFKLLGMSSDLIGVEIGVHEAYNSLDILKNVNIEKLYLVDAWEEYEENGNIIKGLYGCDDMNITFNKAKELLKGYEDKNIWIRKFSHDAIVNIPDNLDFVYIDGNHSYESVKQDIEDYYPKVKSGGILSGHDYVFSEVRKAVNEFGIKNNYRINNSFLNIREEFDPLLGVDWWLVKK